MKPNSLSDEKLEQYKKMLIKLRDQLVQDINNISTDSKGDRDSTDISGHVMHMADVATDIYEREFNLSLASNDREILQKIEAALKRIEDKTYGICEECDKLIPAVRLKALPYVETCLKCQEKLENE